MSLARLNRSASGAAPSSLEANTVRFLSFKTFEPLIRRRTALQQDRRPRIPFRLVSFLATLYDTESWGTDNVCCVASI